MLGIMRMNQQERLGKAQEVADGLWALMLDGRDKGKVAIRDLYTLYKTQRELEADMQTGKTAKREG